MYANLHGYSDIVPYEITRKISDKTMEIRVMNYKLSPDFKPEFVSGGFLAHCTNQDKQTFIFTKSECSKPIRIRLRKDGKWYSIYGRHVLSETPRAFYDYNF